VTGADLKALRQPVKLLEKAGPSGKARSPRIAELVELWKSTPHVLSALGTT
jgi:hypothetical protein